MLNNLCQGLKIVGNSGTMVMWKKVREDIVYTFTASSGEVMALKDSGIRSSNEYHIEM